MTLAVVEDAALTRAAAAADAVLGAARSRADALLADARAEAAARIEARRAAAARLAELEEHERLAAARAQARAIVLGAQRTVREQAIAAAHTALGGLLGDPRHDDLVARLSADASARLAGHEPVAIERLARGGILARAGSRQIDDSLDARAERALAAMAGELEGLWR